MTSRPIRSAATILGMVALGLAACGTESGTPTTGHTSSSAPTSTDSAAPEETTTPEEDPTDSPRAPSDPESSSTGSDTSVSTAVDRFEDFLHAMGDEDIDLLCEIAEPAARIGEEQGFGSCEETFAMTLSTLSGEQKTALSHAGVRTSKVQENEDGTVFFPVECIDADVTFTERNLSSFTMEYQGTDWFVIA